MSGQRIGSKTQTVLILGGSAVLVFFLFCGFLGTLANTIAPVLNKAEEEARAERRSEMLEHLRERSMALAPEQPVDASIASSHSVLAQLQNMIVWAGFADQKPVQVLASPEDLGGKYFCGVAGPNSMGQALICVEERFNTDQRLYQVDLHQGAARLVYRVGKELTIGFGPTLLFSLAREANVAAVWLQEGGEQIPGAYHVYAKPVIYDLDTGRKEQCPVAMIDQPLWLSSKGDRLYGAALASKAFAEWTAKRAGPRPPLSDAPKTPMVVRYDRKKRTTDWIAEGRQYFISEDESRMVFFDSTGAASYGASSGLYAPPAASGHSQPLKDGYWYAAAFPLIGDLEDQSSLCSSGGALQPAIMRADTNQVSRAPIWTCIVLAKQPNVSFGPWSGPAKPITVRSADLR